MAFDGFGNLYVADSSLNSIEVYAPGSNQPLRTITDGVQQPIALVFDPAGNLCVGGVALNEYAPGKFYPKRTIAYNTISRSFAFDDVGRFYAEDDGGAILVYSPVTYKLVNTISAGVNFALAIAFGL
jgi:DNA-binding beta-propeller fold protein YncE